MRILTYNIQAGIGTQSSRDLILGVRRQFRDSPRKQQNLEKIAEFIQDFDIVCLQEVDLGGRRSGGISQLVQLMDISGLSHSAVQLNRVVGKVSMHGNAVLSRHKISNVLDRKLPGRIQGRGKIICEIEGMTIVNTHLSLAPKAQAEQLQFIAGDLKSRENIVMCGDLNLRAGAGALIGFAKQCDLNILTHARTKTHPSWSPKRDLDHILTSHTLQAQPVKVHAVRMSDHLPVSAVVMADHRA